MKLKLTAETTSQGLTAGMAEFGAAAAGKTLVEIGGILDSVVSEQNRTISGRSQITSMREGEEDVAVSHDNKYNEYHQ